jgi:NADH-quinone oxidoreductase subunit M
MILAGVLLKMGGYGLMRISYPILPAAAASQVATVTLAVIGIVSIVYGAAVAMAQTDFTKLVAYSSVSHMGWVLLGLAITPSIFAQGGNIAGLSGAMFQMISHGLTSAMMFFLVGVIYERVHHRDINRLGGLALAMPVYFGARELPRRATCASNLRQIGAAFSLYLADWGGAFPNTGDPYLWMGRRWRWG